MSFHLIHRVQVQDPRGSRTDGCPHQQPVEVGETACKHVIKNIPSRKSHYHNCDRQHEDPSLLIDHLFRRLNQHPDSFEHDPDNQDKSWNTAPHGDHQKSTVWPHGFFDLWVARESLHKRLTPIAYAEQRMLASFFYLKLPYAYAGVYQCPWVNGVFLVAPVA